MTDRPGALAAVLGTVARLRANVLDVHHNRAFLRGPHSATPSWSLTLETRGAAHVEELTQALVSQGYEVTRRW